MIYLDSSVLLAHLLMEERRPPIAFWEQMSVSSRLLEYEVWNRIWARGLGQSHRDEIRAMFRKIEMVELTQLSLRRALEPFPVGIRTLDACISRQWISSVGPESRSTSRATTIA